MPNVRGLVSQYEQMIQQRNEGGSKPTATKVPDVLSDPLQSKQLSDPLDVTPKVDTTPKVNATPKVDTTPKVDSSSLVTPPTVDPSLTPSSPGLKTKGSLGGGSGKVNKAPAKTWGERNDAKPWDVDYKTFATEGHTSHHLIPDNSLLKLGSHITEMGLWGQKDTKEFTDEFIMRDVLANTDPSKHEEIKEKLTNYKAKTKRKTGELGGLDEVEDTGLQGVLHDGANEALDDVDLQDFAKKFQGAFEWRPANTVLGPTSSLRWDDPKDGFDVPATLLAYGDKGMTEEIAQNSKDIKDFSGDNDTSTAPGKLSTVMQGLLKQNREGEKLTGKDTGGKPLPFMTKREDWIEQTKSNKGELDKYDGDTVKLMDKVRVSKGGEEGAQRVQATRGNKRPASVSKDGFVTNTNPDDVSDIRSRLNV